MAHNALFRLFQEQTSPFTVMTVSDKTNHRVLQVMMDIPEMIKTLDHILDENPTVIILDLKNHKMINF